MKFVGSYAFRGLSPQDTDMPVIQEKWQKINLFFKHIYKVVHRRLFQLGKPEMVYPRFQVQISYAYDWTKSGWLNLTDGNTGGHFKRTSTEQCKIY